MPVDITEKTSGLTISAREIRDNVEAIQEFVNGGIRNADLERSSLETENILKPEFYGSPSPRVEGVSSDTYYRSKECLVVYFAMKRPSLLLSLVVFMLLNQADLAVNMNIK